jgi:hypothetical protein
MHLGELLQKNSRKSKKKYRKSEEKFDPWGMKERGMMLSLVESLCCSEDGELRSRFSSDLNLDLDFFRPSVDEDPRCQQVALKLALSRWFN